jgi:hypothetical protein
MNIEREKELYKQMDLLQMKEVSTYRQQKNGTRIFELPIIKYGSKIQVGSFKSGYVRRMNGCYTPYQLNKCEPVDHYYKDYKTIWNKDRSDYIQKPTGKYNKYVGKRRILIPNEVDRLKYLIAYCLKNYYINQANEVENGEFIPKWKHKYEMKNGSIDKVRELQNEIMKYERTIRELHEEMDNICEEHSSKDQKYTFSGGQITDSETGEIYVHDQHAYWNKLPNSVQVIVDGHRYKIK